MKNRDCSDEMKANKYDGSSLKKKGLCSDMFVYICRLSGATGVSFRAQMELVKLNAKSSLHHFANNHVNFQRY